MAAAQRKAPRDPAVRTAPPIRTRELAPGFLASLRRLGVDDATLKLVTGQTTRRRALFS